MWRVRMFRPCENNVKRLWISLQHFWWTLQRVWQVVRAPLRHGVRLVCACVLMLAVLRFDVPPPNNLSSNLDRMLAGRQFDFAGWWVHAFSNKVLQELTLWQNGMTEQQQVAYVRQHMRAIAQYQDLESQITQLFVDPHVADKTTATAALRAERDVLRVQLAAQQDLAEAILQEQVESVLREEGFAIGGQVLPPLRFRFTELPDIIIVSRRDRIDRIASRELQTGLTVDQQDKIEREVDARFDVSSLVSGIGGLGAYPTMLPETGALRWVLGVIAHEWTHNYFLYVLSPIGWNYSEDGKAAHDERNGSQHCRARDWPTRDTTLLPGSGRGTAHGGSGGSRGSRGAEERRWEGDWSCARRVLPCFCRDVRLSQRDARDACANR